MSTIKDKQIQEQLTIPILNWWVNSNNPQLKEAWDRYRITMSRITGNLLSILLMDNLTDSPMTIQTTIITMRVISSEKNMIILAHIITHSIIMIEVQWIITSEEIITEVEEEEEIEETVVVTWIKHIFKLQFKEHRVMQVLSIKWIKPITCNSITNITIDIKREE